MHEFIWKDISPSETDNIHLSPVDPKKKKNPATKTRKIPEYYYEEATTAIAKNSFFAGSAWLLFYCQLVSLSGQR